jgi:hypothetical protein
MSYKWIDFGSSTVGRGANTVVLGDLALHKKQLGNMAFVFVPTIYHPNVNAIDMATVYQSHFGKELDNPRKAVLNNRREVKSTIEAIARIGYAIEPYYKKPSFGEFGDKVVYRADNLAAFAVGRQLAWEFMESVHAGDNDKAKSEIKKMLSERNEKKKNQNINILGRKLEKLLNEKFANDGAGLSKVVGELQKLQPIPNAPPITLDAMTFTPEYGGFNFRSLKGKEKAVDLPIGSKTSIAVGTEIWNEFKTQSGGNNRDKFKEWRTNKYERWTEPGNGFSVTPDTK